MPFSWEETVITPSAIKDAENLGLEGDLEAKIKDMLRHSAPFSHERGNRRFGVVMMLVQNNMLCSISRIENDPIKDALAAKSLEKLIKKRQKPRLT